MKAVIEGGAAIVRSPLGFANGLSYAFRGMRFVYFQHPTLARYWLFPVLITAVAIYGSALVRSGRSGRPASQGPIRSIW